FRADCFSRFGDFPSRQHADNKFPVIFAEENKEDARSPAAIGPRLYCRDAGHGDPLPWQR
ncbi:MAG: hypothetical protein ACTSWM_02615, partial [Alphaproteobacteria bacterium]